MDDRRDSYWRASVGRRRLLRNATVAGSGGLAGVALIACSSTTNNNNTGAPTTAATRAAANQAAATPAIAGSTAGTPARATAAAQAPRKGGEYIASLTSLANQSLDPHISLSKAWYYWGLISERIFEPQHQTIEPLQPLLVDKVEQVDPSTLSLTVRQGINWHQGKLTNGRPLTAADLVFNIERITGKYDPSRQALFQRASLLNGLGSVQAVDDKTVKLTFTTPNALFLNGLAAFQNTIVPPELVQKDPQFQNAAEFAGVGPFIIQSYDDLSSQAKYAPNPAYWRQGQPYFSSVQQLTFADSASLSAAFVSKKVHSLTGAADNVDSVKKARPDAVFMQWPQLLYYFWRLNQAHPQLKDVRVRKALHLALNYKDLMDPGFGTGLWQYSGPIISGTAGAWSSDKVKSQPGWNPATKQQDVADAKKLMEAAGFPNGKGLNFGLMQYTFSAALADTAVRIKDQMGKVFGDISINIQPPADAGQFATKQASGDYDSEDFGIITAGGSGLLEASQHYRTGGSRNYTKFSDPPVDALITKGLTEFDAAARDKIVDQLEQKIVDDVVMVLVLGRPDALEFVDPKIRGLDTFVGAGTSYEAYAYAVRQMSFGD